MSRKEQYKVGASGTSDIRERCRGQEIGLRKQKRDKVINSKRVRLEEVAEELQEIKYTVEQVKQTSKALQVHSNDRLSLLKTLKKMFAQGSALIEAFLSVDNSLRCLVGLLSGTDPALQLEAAWCVTNLSASIHEHCMLALKHAAPYLITYLSGQNAVLQDQCCWALGNIAGDGPECRDTLISQGALQPIINLLEIKLTILTRILESTPAETPVKFYGESLCGLSLEIPPANLTGLAGIHGLSQKFHPLSQLMADIANRP